MVQTLLEEMRVMLSAFNHGHLGVLTVERLERDCLLVGMRVDLSRTPSSAYSKPYIYTLWH